jgi:hypothetical protein
VSPAIQETFQDLLRLAVRPELKIEDAVRPGADGERQRGTKPIHNQRALSTRRQRRTLDDASATQR